MIYDPLIECYSKRAFDKAALIPRYKQYIADAKTNHQPYTDLLLYDKWLASTEQDIIHYANKIISYLEASITQH